MLRVPVSRVIRLLNRELQATYAKAGIMKIMPEVEFDIRRDMLIPGRSGMIKNFRDIELHVGEVRSLRGKLIELSNGWKRTCFSGEPDTAWTWTTSARSRLPRLEA